jgi:hypothetical protein
MAKASAVHTTSLLFRQFRQRARIEGGGWLKRVMDLCGVSELDQLTNAQMRGALAMRPIRDPWAA